MPRRPQLVMAPFGFLWVLAVGFPHQMPGPWHCVVGTGTESPICVVVDLVVQTRDLKLEA